MCTKSFVVFKSIFVHFGGETVDLLLLQDLQAWLSFCLFQKHLLLGSETFDYSSAHVYDHRIKEFGASLIQGPLLSFFTIWRLM